MDSTRAAFNFLGQCMAMLLHTHTSAERGQQRPHFSPAVARFSPSIYDARNHACCLCLAHVTTASVPEYLTVFLLFGASQFFERLVKGFSVL